jgi:hypothetical protein
VEIRGATKVILNEPATGEAGKEGPESQPHMTGSRIAPPQHSKNNKETPGEAPGVEIALTIPSKLEVLTRDALVPLALGTTDSCKVSLSILPSPKANNACGQGPDHPHSSSGNVRIFIFV